MNTEELLRLHCHAVCGRGLGHTTAAINGVKSTDAILICATSQHARDIRAEHQVQAIGVKSIDQLLGTRHPKVYDHHAVDELCSMALSKIAMLRNQIAVLRDQTAAR